jgi:hypothetical protein
MLVSGCAVMMREKFQLLVLRQRCDITYGINELQCRFIAGIEEIVAGPKNSCHLMVTPHMID